MLRLTVAALWESPRGDRLGPGGGSRLRGCAVGGGGTLWQSDLRVESQNLVELFVREEGEGGGRSGGGAVSGAPEEAEIHVVS